MSLNVSGHTRDFVGKAPRCPHPELSVVMPLKFGAVSLSTSRPANALSAYWSSSVLTGMHCVLSTAAAAT